MLVAAVEVKALEASLAADGVAGVRASAAPRQLALGPARPRRAGPALVPARVVAVKRARS
jgi:hypothetical protein